MICLYCNANILDGATICPICQKPTTVESLALSATQQGVDRSLNKKIAEEQFSLSLSKMENLINWQRDMEVGQIAYISPEEQKNFISMLAPSPVESITIDGIADLNDIKFNGLQLKELLDGGSPNTVEAIKTGLIFLKNKRVAEATEWWNLHRNLVNKQTDGKTDFLFLLLLLLTHQLAGRAELYERALAEVRAHTHFSLLRFKTLQ